MKVTFEYSGEPVALPRPDGDFDLDIYNADGDRVEFAKVIGETSLSIFSGLIMTGDGRIADDEIPYGTYTAIISSNDEVLGLPQ